MVAKTDTGAVEDLVAAVVRSPVEMTLREMLAQAGLLDSPLSGAASLRDELSKSGIVIRPPIGDGLEVVHELTIPWLHEQSRHAENELDSGEHHYQEFKSSLWFDRQRAKFDENAGIKELKSADVCHSALKTICAFANSGSGMLWIGVDDDGVPVGVQEDLGILNIHGASWRDKFELHIRDLISDRFKDGKLLNDRIGVSFPDVKGVEVARVSVGRMRRLACLRATEGRWVAYRRQGNRTDELTMDIVEDFIMARVEAGSARGTV